MSLYLTDSRGSIIGLLFGIIALYCVKNGRVKYFVSVMIVAQMVMYVMSYYFAPDDFLSVNLMTVDSIDLDENIERGGTFINRFFYLWPRAIYLFLQSPILGVGFGAYDDWPYKLVGEYGFVCINDSSIYHTDGHAHNSYLNILAETGIVGFLLFGIFIKQIYMKLKNSLILRDKMAAGLMICLWASLVSALTEHRMFAPAQMLPFYILLGMFLSTQKDNER